MRLPTFDDVSAAARRLEGHARQTPVLTHPELDAVAGAELFIKAECLQVTGSFKIRGAMNRLAQIPDAQKPAGVVAFSSGNHAQGVARAARLLGMPAAIVMPSDAPEVKVSGVRADGGEVILYDRDTGSREEIATRLCEERGAILVPSYDDPDIIAGQGTAGLEFARQMEDLGGPLDHLVCCTGGGGLTTGMALAFEALSPRTQVWTAEPIGHEDWKRSLEQGEITANLPGTRSICDAILTPEPGKITFALGQHLLSGGFAASDDEVRSAMRAAFRYLKIVAEPGGAIAMAVALNHLPGAFRGARVGIIVSGGNVDPGQFASILAGS